MRSLPLPPFSGLLLLTSSSSPPALLLSAPPLDDEEPDALALDALALPLSPFIPPREMLVLRPRIAPFLLPRLIMEHLMP